MNNKKLRQSCLDIDAFKSNRTNPIQEKKLERLKKSLMQKLLTGADAESKYDICE